MSPSAHSEGSGPLKLTWTWLPVQDFAGELPFANFDRSPLVVRQPV
jgi:hypothetical protein